MKENHTVTIENESEMVGYLKSLGTECRFISMTTETPVKMRKTGNPYADKGIIKVTRRNGLINVNYVRSVERKMAAAAGVKVSEVDYTAGTTWYKHCETLEGKAMPLCVDKKTESKHYLQYFPHRSMDTKYFYDGKEIEYSKFESFVQVSKKSEFKPLVITLKMDSIKKIKFRKITAVNENDKPLSRLKGLTVDLAEPVTV